MPLKQVPTWGDSTVADFISNVFAFGAVAGSVAHVVLYRSPRRYTVTVRAGGNHTRTMEVEVRPDAPPAATFGWVWKAAVATVLTVRVGVLLWLRRRRTAKQPHDLVPSA